MNIGIFELLIILVVIGLPIALIVGAIVLIKRLVASNQAVGESQQVLHIDRRSDSAFLALGRGGNQTVEVIVVPAHPRIAGQVNLHVDGQGHVTGVELLSARTILPESAWNQPDSSRRQ